MLPESSCVTGEFRWKTIGERSASWPFAWAAEIVGNCLLAQVNMRQKSQFTDALASCSNSFENELALAGSMIAALCEPRRTHFRYFALRRFASSVCDVIAEANDAI